MGLAMGFDRESGSAPLSRATLWASNSTRQARYKDSLKTQGLGSSTRTAAMRP